MGNPNDSTTSWWEHKNQKLRKEIERLKTLTEAQTDKLWTVRQERDKANIEKELARISAKDKRLELVTYYAALLAERHQEINDLKADRNALLRHKADETSKIMRLEAEISRLRKPDTATGVLALVRENDRLTGLVAYLRAERKRRDDTILRQGTRLRKIKEAVYGQK